jgi:hypothetical protein
MIILLSIYILNTLTALVNLEKSTTSFKAFIALNSHFTYNIRPLKTDSAPVRGDGYKPGSLTQSQRRDVAQRAIEPGGGYKRYRR